MNEIETIFYNTFIEYVKNKNVCLNNNIYNVKQDDCEEKTFSFSMRDYERSFIIDFEEHPQDECFSGYIPDFAIFMKGLYQGFAIEIDGHEWHEKTKEQAQRDKRKDRAYIKKGFIPIHFTGSEVFHNSEDCIRELFEIIDSNIQFFEYDTINGLYEGEKLAAEHTANEIEELQEKIYQLCYGKIAKKAIFISKGKVELTPNITETA